MKIIDPNPTKVKTQQTKKKQHQRATSDKPKATTKGRRSFSPLLEGKSITIPVDWSFTESRST